MKSLYFFPKLLLVFCIITINAVQSSAQIGAPTLGAGINYLSGQKGTIDVVLLSQIINEKQEAVKKEMLQRLLLNKMEAEGFALQNFIYSNFNALLTYNEAQSIEKELLSQFAILSLQTGIAETYLKMSFKKFQPAPELEIVIKDFIRINAGASETDKIYNELLSTLKNETFPILFSFDSILERIYASKKIKNKSGTKFSALLLDMIFESTRRNTTLQKLGFVKLHPNLKSDYLARNSYLKHSIDKSGTKNNLLELYNLLDKLVETLVEYHPIIHDFIDDKNITLSDLIRASKKSKDNTEDALILSKINELKDFKQTISKGFSQLLASNSIVSVVLEKNAEKLTRLSQGLNDFETRNRDNSKIEFNLNDYYFITQEVEPYANQLISLGIVNSDQLDDIESIRSYAFDQLMQQLDISLAHPSLEKFKEVSIEEYGHLIKMTSSLSRLDEVSTYEFLFNSLSQFGINNSNKSSSTFLRDLIYYTQAFTEIDRKNNQLNINVEALILKILSLYENRTSTQLQLYASIGADQTAKINYANSAHKLFSNNGEEIKNMTFAAEKIGLKLKLLDNKKAMSHSYLERNKLQQFFTNNKKQNNTPLISDVYLIAYGSGLLYSVSNLTTAGEQFNHPMIGFGAGIAMYNALDFNIWLSSPLISDESIKSAFQNRNFIGFSFDIKLTEYLTALGKKRQLTKKLD